MSELHYRYVKLGSTPQVPGLRSAAHPGSKIEAAILMVKCQEPTRRLEEDIEIELVISSKFCAGDAEDRIRYPHGGGKKQDQVKTSAAGGTGNGRLKRLFASGQAQLMINGKGNVASNGGHKGVVFSESTKNLREFLGPPDILSVRKTCKRFQAITLGRHVWTTAYKSSEDKFMPAVDLDSQTVGDLERVLLHAYQLDTLWATPSAKPVCKHYWSIDSAAYGGQSFDGIELYRVAILSSRIPRFMETALDWSGTVENGDCDFFFLFLDCILILFLIPAFTGSEMLLLKISPLGAVSVDNFPILNVDKADELYLSDDGFAIIQDKTMRSIRAVHLPSQAVYPIHSEFKCNHVDVSSVPIFLPGGYVLLEFMSSCGNSGHHFELYRLSDYTAGTLLLPTHQGNFDNDSDLSLLSCDIPLNDGAEFTGRIWLLMDRDEGPQPLCITLDTGGCLTFSEAPFLDSLSELQLTLHPEGKSRGIAAERSKEGSGGKAYWVLCHVSMDTEEPLIHTGARLEMHGMDVPLVDVSQGFVITQTRESIFRGQRMWIEISFICPS
ncbi:hypothetical protein BDP27DRAFT_1367779 [Rhodocollybia butyracea]|uniref:F-box domain-containing protein n=1 Tax=Rhodocollybia butyracea TaxID=206335 RepID=A0A9P5PJJ0_9AGAR|nr:hypothetical protein BDP27DRAFT_1367779 [Rhodocollybia butyracea]